MTEEERQKERDRQKARRLVHGDKIRAMDRARNPAKKLAAAKKEAIAYGDYDTTTDESDHESEHPYTYNNLP